MYDVLYKGYQATDLIMKLKVQSAFGITLNNFKQV